jgi:hypothetical protein
VPKTYLRSIVTKFEKRALHKARESICIHKVVGKKTHPCKKMAKIVEITVLKFYILIRTEKGKLIER